MKAQLFAVVLGFGIMSSALASTVDPVLKDRIIKACISSSEAGGRKIPNYKAVCKCIGEAHSRSAALEPVQKEADEHMNWTVLFYETSDMKSLQRMIKSNPALSSYDDQVVDDCMESVKSGFRK